MAPPNDTTHEEPAARLPLLDNGIGAAASARAAHRPTQRWIAAVACSAVFLGGSAFAFLARSANRSAAGAEATAALASTPQADVVALGRLRPKGDITAVATPFGAGDARIEQLLVGEGDRVARGDLLAVLDNRGKYEAALEDAQKNLESRRAALAQTVAQVAAAKAETTASLESARIALEAAEEQLRRSRSLQERGFIAQHALDDAESAAAAARGDVARLTATMSRYDDGSSGTQADIAVARANVASAESAVQLAQRDLDLAKIFSPRDGTILELSVREGEKAPPDRLLKLGDIDHMEAELEVFQSLAPRVEVGQRVSIFSDVLGKAPLTGTVSHVGMLVGRQSVTAEDPAAKTDARIVPVVVELDGRSSERAGRYVGLEVVGRIEAPSSAAPLRSTR